MRGARLLGGFGVLALACGLAGCAPEPETPWEGTTGGETTGAVRRCAPPEGMSGRPETIEAAVALIEALPKPVTVGCFLESLDRPLEVNATSATLSAQPAVGAANPRLFIFSGALIISAVSAGDGRELVEFGQLTGLGRSIKAEVLFPVTGAIPAGEPYARMMYDDKSTSCAFCHADERQVDTIGGAAVYESRALKPIRALDVPIEDVRAEHEACDPAQEPERCAIFEGLFGFGEVVQGAFPPGLTTLQ